MNIAGIIYESLRKTGGYEIFTYNLFKALVSRGHQVTLYLQGKEYGKHRDFYDSLPFRVRPLLFQTQFLFKHALPVLHKFVAREQKKHCYDVWQVMGACREAGIAEGLQGMVPLVLRVYGEDVYVNRDWNFGMRLNPAYDAMIRRAVNKMDRIVAMTPSLAGALLELGVSEDRIISIPNGIGLAQFGKTFDRDAARAKWGFGPDDFVMLTLGRYHLHKGSELIPEIARRIKEQGRSFKWLVIGRGTQALEPAVEAAGVEDCVLPRRDIGLKRNPAANKLFDLPVEEVVELYAMADLFVFPSRLEGFPRVILESLAAGLPVVISDAPGCGEVVEDGIFGLVAPMDDTARMAQRVMELMDDRPKLRQLSEAAKLHAQQFDWDEIATQYEAVYRELAKR
jgi:glycosyltransferase involved in cell wall biosynthesis